MVDTPPNVNSPSVSASHQPAVTQPTTSSTTSVIIPTAAPAPQPRSGYTEWDNVVFLLGGIIAIIILIGQISGAIKNLAEWLDRKKQKDQEQDAPHEARIKALEEGSKSFRSKEDLDERFTLLNNKIDHEKDNRRMIQDGFEARLRTVSDAQTNDRLVITEIKGKVETLATNSQRVEDAVDSLRTRVDERFDRLHEAIMNKPTKA